MPFGSKCYNLISRGFMTKRPIAIDLFAGAGGLSLGFEQAGFDVMAAVEFDPIHAATHAFNFPNCTVFPRSVSDLQAEDIFDTCGIESGDVDVVFGGPPCQGFSLIGQRALDDPRNSLVGEFARLVSDLDASYFVFENVKGLTIGRHLGFLEELIALFASLGYDIRLPWRVLNACHFGVPQDRERLFLIGAKKGLDLPDYPEATTTHPNELLTDLPHCPTCKQALDDLPEVENYPELLESDEVQTEDFGPPSSFAKKLRCATRESWGVGYRREWNKNILTCSMRTRHTDISVRRFASTGAGTIEPISRFFKLPEDGVSNTLRAGTDSSRGAFTSPRPIHYSSARCITVREMARLHGFPDWFRFHRTKWHGARQVGNSVPPPLANAIASSLIGAMHVTPSPPETVIATGDPSLLSMDMSHAAQYWDVPKPLGRRDKKSPFRKRKQIEIEQLEIR